MLGVDGRRRSSKTEKRLSHLARTLRRFSQQNIAGEECLIELTDCEGETPLHAAVTSGNAEMVKVNHTEELQTYYLYLRNDIEYLIFVG